MKTVLIFDSFEEREEALQAQHAVDYLVALDEIEQEVRRLWKYVEYEHEGTYEAIDRLHDFVSNILAELPGYER